MRRGLAVTALLALGPLLSSGGGREARADDKGDRSDKTDKTDKTEKARCIAASEQGQQLRDSGQYSAARDAFTRCARDACPALVRRDCTRWLSDVTQLWPSVVFGAKDPSGNDLTDVNVRSDGAPMASTLDGRPVPIDPGDHLFRFEAKGFPAVERHVLVRAGEKSRLVVAQFGEGPAPASPPHGLGTGPARTEGAPIPSGVWVFGGLAVVAFGTEAYFGITGLSDRSSLESQPCAKTATCSSDAVTSIRTKFTVADIALGVGLVSAGLSAYLYFSRGSARPEEAPAAQFDLVPTTGGAAATWRARF
jgi:hypothetical protein